MQQITLVCVYISEMHKTIPHTLIDRCSKGESSAQMELYSILFAGVFNSSFRIVGDRESAEEIVQDSFLKLFDNIDKYKDRVALTVRRIAINASIDLLRKRRVNFVELSSHSDIVAQDTEDITDYDFADINIQDVKRAIDSLSPGYRLVIMLRLIEGMSFVEISQEMGIAQSSARSQFIRAKKRLIEISKIK